MQNGVYFEKDISICAGYLHNEKVFCYKLLSIFIIHQDLSFGGIALKIEFVVFVYELINYEIIFLLLGYATSTAIANQLPSQIVSTQIRTAGI